MPELTTVRRYEAAGFRAWPAASVYYDGAWAVRLTPGHPARRLNSVNPLDPGDSAEIEARVERARKRFADAGKPLIFRISPLAPPALSAHLDRAGWSRISDSHVMRLALDEAAVEQALDQIPLKDVNRFVGAAIAVHHYPDALRTGLADVIAAIQPEAGLFVLEQDDMPIATAICVHDGDLAGLFEVATASDERGKGHGRRILLSALKWARLRGAKVAWLQVEASNVAALSLYRTLGFMPLYTYHYRQPAEAAS
jgi:ribosomal protein S18 acetylase RimI-like enzyme